MDFWSMLRGVGAVGSPQVSTMPWVAVMVVTVGGDGWVVVVVVAVVVVTAGWR